MSEAEEVRLKLREEDVRSVMVGDLPDPTKEEVFLFFPEELPYRLESIEEISLTPRRLRLQVAPFLGGDSKTLTFEALRWVRAVAPSI